MQATPRHTYQVLTKRPARMLECIRWIEAEFVQPTDHWPLPNVWLGVSVENQHFDDGRIPLLLQTPAAVRIISAEPLPGPLYFRKCCDSSQGPDWHPLIVWKTSYRYKAQSPDECSLGVESTSH